MVYEANRVSSSLISICVILSTMIHTRQDCMKPTLYYLLSSQFVSLYKPWYIPGETLILHPDWSVSRVDQALMSGLSEIWLELPSIYNISSNAEMGELTADTFDVWRKKVKFVWPHKNMGNGLDSPVYYLKIIRQDMAVNEMITCVD